MSRLGLKFGATQRKAAGWNQPRIRPAFSDAAVRPRRAEDLALVEEFKNLFLQREIARQPDATHTQWLRSAVEAAASLAWSTELPALFLPILLEEKAREAADRAAKQRDIFSRSSTVIAVAE